MDPTLPIPATAPDGNFSVGTVIASRYVVVRILGAGAMGAVYEVSDASIPERRLALKILHEAARTAAERDAQREELRSMVQVRHPSIIALYDHGEYEGRLFSVLPMMRGESLEGCVFPRKEVHRIGVTLAQALAAMHEVGLTHQDIKPENARLTIFDGVPEPVPVLLDLGTAVHVGTPLRGFSPLFLAPEVARAVLEGGRPLADPKADVYGLAVTLHAILEAPLDDESGDNLTVFLAHRAEGAPPKFRDSKLAFLDPYFARWAAADPALRPTASELALELEALLGPERRRARFLRVAAMALAALVVLGIAGFMVHRANAATAEERRRAEQADARRESAEQRAEHVQTQLGTTRSRLDNASSRVDELTANAQHLADEAQKERDQAESWEARSRRLAKTVSELNALIAQLHAAVAEERTLRDNYAAQVRDRDNQLASATSLQRETAAARDRAASEASQLAVQLDVARRALERSSADLADERDARQRDRASLSAELEQVQSTLAQAQAQLGAAERALDECRSRPVPEPPAPSP